MIFYRSSHGMSSSLLFKKYSTLGRKKYDKINKNELAKQLVGTGAAILALAGAAWSLDLPYVLCFNLFSAIYWFFIYLSIYIRCMVSERSFEKTWLFPKMKAALTRVKEKPYMVFFLNIFSLILSYAIIFLWYLMLAGDRETIVKILLIMGECSAIFFCFCSQNELSRFQAVFSFFPFLST